VDEGRDCERVRGDRKRGRQRVGESEERGLEEKADRKAVWGSVCLCVWVCVCVWVCLLLNHPDLAAAPVGARALITKAPSGDVVNEKPTPARPSEGLDAPAVYCLFNSKVFLSILQL
jgi:hypothetical protein